MKDYYLKTSDEILGIYDHGNAPVIFDDEAVPIQATQVHEKGHRQLCETTPLGLYIQALSYVCMFRKDEAAAAESTVEALLEQCWRCQEGYATFRQVCYFMLEREFSQAPEFISRLPDAYRGALETFQFDVDAVAQLLVQEGYGEEILPDLLWLALENAGYVLARAAMSLPLADFLRRREILLPGYRVVKFVCEDPPDVRLETLRPGCSPEFIAKVAKATFLAFNEMKARKSYRPLDDRMDQCTQLLCDSVGVAYEPSYQLDVADVYAKLKLQGFVEFSDARLLSIDKMLPHEVDSRTVHRNRRYATFQSIPLNVIAKMAAAFPVEYVPNGQDSLPHVVCEILPIKDGDEQYSSGIHLFCDFDVESATPLPTKIDMVRFAGWLRQGRLGDEPPEVLPKSIPHSSWTWILHWSMFEETTLIRRFDLDQFQATGMVFSPVLPQEPVHGMRTIVGNVPLCYDWKPGEDRSVTIDPILESKGIVSTYPTRSLHDGITVVAFAEQEEHSPFASTISPELRRVCCALSSGAYSVLSVGLAASLAEKASQDDQ